MHTKKIYIEALGLVDKHFSGVGQYIFGLLKGLDELIGDDIKNGKKPPEIYVLIPWSKLDRFNEFKFKHLKAKRIPLHERILSGLWHRGLLPPIDIFFGRGYYIFTRFVSMPLLFSKYAVIIYDLSYELHRQFSEDRNADFLSSKVPETVRKANTVITISQNAKEELSDFYKIDDSKIIVAYPATDPAIFKPRASKEVEEVKQKYGIKGKYIISLSNLEPRKNLTALIDGYCMLGDEVKDVSLVIVGVKGWKADALLEKINTKIKHGHKIIMPTTYVDDLDKVALLSGATMLVYPSHYEGFGMPPLEALACGTPVIVSNNSSLPEAVGSIGVLLNDNQPADISKAIRKELSAPSDVSAAGPLQARKFSWRASAQKFIDLAKS